MAPIPPDIIAALPENFPKDVDRRRLRRTFPGKHPHEREVYIAALHGKTAREIAETVWPEAEGRPAESTFHKRYQVLVNEARLLHPDIFPEWRKHSGHTPPPNPLKDIDEAELRRLARTTAPDTILAIHFGVDVGTLRKYWRKVINEERAKLGLELAEKYVGAALGTPDEMDKEGKLVKAGRAPDMAIGEKLLGRIGFMEAPMENELTVRILHDAPPERKPEGDGPRGRLADLGDETAVGDDE